MEQEEQCRQHVQGCW